MISLRRGIGRVFSFSTAIPPFHLRYHSIQAASAGFVCFAILLDVAFSAFANLIVFQNQWLAPMARQTNYLLQPGLPVYLVKIALFAVILFRYRKLTPGDVGLKREGLVSGVGVTLGIWLAVQLLGMTLRLLQGSGLMLSDFWLEYGTVRVVGVQLANLANVLFEESFFRGFLAVQALLLLSGVRCQQPGHKQIFVAILLSQLVFSFSHLPNRIFQGLSLSSLLADQIQLIGIGSLLTLFYFRSGSLYLVMGVHLLANWPMSLFLDQQEAAALVYGVAILLLIFWKANPPARTLTGG